MLIPDLDNVRKTLQRYPFPVDVIVEVTAFCNLKCIMCPQKSLTREKGEMSLELFQKIADEVARENPATRIWLAIMGEPLFLGEKLVKMVKYAKDNGIKSVNLNTNGLLLTPDLSDRLIDAGLDYIIFGIDAFSKETYVKIRVGGDFDQLNKNIDYIIEAKTKKKSDLPTLILQYIVMGENEEELEAFKSHWLGKGQVVKIRPKLGWGTGVKADNLNLPDSERDFPCSWLARTVSIHWNGKFAQCDADYDGKFSPGNLHSSTIKELWQGELAQRREKHWNLDFTHDLCSECKDWQAGRSIFIYPENKKPPR